MTGAADSSGMYSLPAIWKVSTLKASVDAAYFGLVTPPTVKTSSLTRLAYGKP